MARCPRHTAGLKPGLQRRNDSYVRSHPCAADVLLLIEVSDTTLRYDRQIKLPLYARHGVQEVWLVDVNSNSLRRCSDPVQDRYMQTATITASGAMPLVLAPDIRIDLSEMFELLRRY
jgi:Uma2 family endonuclease